MPTDLIGLEPDNSEAYLSRAIVRATMEQIPRNMFDFQRAIDRYPDLGTTYYLRAYFTTHDLVTYQVGAKSDDVERFKQDLGTANDLE